MLLCCDSCFITACIYSRMRRVKKFTAPDVRVRPDIGQPLLEGNNHIETLRLTKRTRLLPTCVSRELYIYPWYMRRGEYCHYNYNILIIELIISDFSYLINTTLLSSSENRINGAPNSYVTYQTSEQADLTCTAVFPKSADPVWDHEHNTRLDHQLLVQGGRHLVFKVWHHTLERNLTAGMTLLQTVYRVYLFAKEHILMATGMNYCLSQ